MEGSWWREGRSNNNKKLLPNHVEARWSWGQDHPIVDMDVQEDDKRRGKPVEDLVSTPLVFEEPEELPA